jgi:hypothetical protein
MTFLFILKITTQSLGKAWDEGIQEDNNMAQKKQIFTPVSEKEVTRAIVDGFARQFIDYVESDCLIVGGGPSGLQDCRLFNSHWQEEVLHSQMDGQYEFCPRHEEILEWIRR